MEILGLSYGNYIQTPEGIKAITGVVKLFEGSIIHWNGNQCKAAHCKPVELTTEILEACGFELKLGRWWSCVKRQYDNLDSFVFVDRIDEDPNGMYYFGFKSPFSACNINNIYHLHELQNAYYSLTKTLLKVNLKEAQEG